MKRSVFLLCCLLAAPAAAQNLPDLPDLGDLPPPSRYLAGYVSAGLGWGRPIGGHWGDGDTGFKTSPTLSLAASKRVDELLSYGAETCYGGRYLNRGVDGLQVKLLSLTPFLKASFPYGDSAFYGVLGAGLYHWRQQAYTAGAIRRSSDSGSSGGFNLGGGASYPFLFGTRMALDLRWHHVFNISGANMDLGSADSLNAMFTVTHGVWKNRKTP
jgi:hypothetical protein